MSVISFFLRPLPQKKNSALIFCMIQMILFLASSIYMTMFFELPLPVVIIALLMLCYLFYRIKLHTMLIKLPLIYHLIAVLIFAYMAHGFYSFPAGGTFYMLVSAGACGTVCFSMVEIISAALLNFLSDRPHPERILPAFAAVFPLLFTVLVFVPSETYFLNSKDLLFVFWDFAPYLFIRTAIFTLISSVAVCSLSDKAFRMFSGITAGLTMCVYCQYMFFNRSLPLSIGEPMDQELLSSQMIINTVLWILILLIFVAYVLLSQRIKSLMSKAAVCNAHLLLCSFIAGVQMLSLGVMIFTTDISLFNHERYLLDNSEQFVVSGKKNIITFILDSSDREYFDDVYEKEPEKFEFLKDFTYYNNACMMYDSTYLSIPQMLSGTVDYPEYDLNTWLNESWSSDPCEAFYSRLHSEGYKVNVFGDFAYNYNCFVDKFDNCQFQPEESIRVSKDNIYANLDALAAYRYMPYLFKETFLNSVEDLDRAIVYSSTCIMENKQYLDNLELKKSDDSNYFIVEHLLGTHWQSGGTVYQRVCDCLEILKKYTDQLKQLGLYDSSIIIVTGDHGEHLKKDNVPIWYIKPANAHNLSMQLCSAPIHHSDYLATCLDAAGLKKDTDGDLFGRSIFDISESDQRERILFQRFGFEYAGEIKFNICVDLKHRGAAYGYRFTGTREDLVKREEEGPPDVLIELRESY